jgi:hypothetical protein
MRDLKVSFDVASVTEVFEIAERGGRWVIVGVRGQTASRRRIPPLKAPRRSTASVARLDRRWSKPRINATNLSPADVGA